MKKEWSKRYSGTATGNYEKSHLQLHNELDACKRAGIISKKESSNLENLIEVNPALAQQILNKFRGMRLNKRNITKLLDENDIQYSINIEERTVYLKSKISEELEEQLSKQRDFKIQLAFI